MKILRLASLLAMVLSLSGCSKEIVPEVEDIIRRSNTPVVRYWTCVSFLDSSGNDLVSRLMPKGDISNWRGGIDSGQYDLCIYLADGSKTDIVNLEYYSMYNFFGDYPDFEKQYGKYDGRYYLYNDFMYPYMVPTDFQSMLTFKVTCPTIFGDNSVHELVTYWGDDPNVTNKSEKESMVYDSDGNPIYCQYPQCKRASFDGKKASVKKAIFFRSQSRDYYSYFIDIVLDK